MEILEIDYKREVVPHNFTGIARHKADDARVFLTQYYINGRLHREDGPAVEWTHIDHNGRPIHESCRLRYYLDGYELTRRNFYIKQYSKYRGTELGIKIAAELLGANNNND